MNAPNVRMIPLEYIQIVLVYTRMQLLAKQEICANSVRMEALEKFLIVFVTMDQVNKSKSYALPIIYFFYFQFCQQNIMLFRIFVSDVRLEVMVCFQTASVLMADSSMDITVYSVHGMQMEHTETVCVVVIKRMIKRKIRATNVRQIGEFEYY